MYKIFATAEDAGKHSFKTSGFLNGHDCVVKVDAGYILVPVSTYSGWTDYNAVVSSESQEGKTMKYQDRFCCVETTNEGFAFYADIGMGYFEMSNNMGAYIIKKLNNVGLGAYGLIGLAESIIKRRKSICMD